MQKPQTILRFENSCKSRDGCVDFHLTWSPELLQKLKLQTLLLSDRWSSSFMNYHLVERLCSTVEGYHGYHQYCEKGYHQYCEKGYHQYCGGYSGVWGISSLFWRDTINTVGEYVLSVLWNRIPLVLWTVFRSFSWHKLPWHSNYNSLSKQQNNSNNNVASNSNQLPVKLVIV